MHIKFLRHILSIADATYVCSDAMRVEYELIFGVNFDVVSNRLGSQQITRKKITRTLSQEQGF